MRRLGSLSALRWVSLFLISAALLLAVLQLVTYSRVRGDFPRGMTIAGVSVAGLDHVQAAERLMQVYATPVEVRYGNAIVHIKPSVIGFELDLEAMLSAAELQRLNSPFWLGFWDYLWNRAETVTPVPLRASVPQDRLRAYLRNEIASRYDQSPSAAVPVPGSTSFQAGQPGTVLDVDSAAQQIGDALRSPTGRIVVLNYSQTSAPRPSLRNLEILLKQIIDLAQFNGVAEVYLRDLNNQQEILFAHQADQAEAIPTGISFSSWSTIKIPVMVSTFRRLGDNPPPEAIQLIESMVEKSDNDSTDALAATIIDENLGPLLISEDMQTLGLANTFWGGYFYPGAVLLKRYETPANVRTDINTDPDPYSQTTPYDLGLLLEDIYTCSQTGGGALAAAFNGEVTQRECEQMITFLSRNDIPVLIQAGLPGSIQIAHKHGWAQEAADGLLHTIADASIVYTPGANYVLVVFVHDPVQAVFDPVNQMVAEISRAVYNFFNATPQ